jgi:diguanylate cyclase (GGDEF)-like protein
LSGTFAASMENLARLTVDVLRVPAALVALLGDDRRTFAAGSHWLEWFAHDSGALVRAGILRRTVENGGILTLEDARRSEELELRAAAAELSLVSLAATTIAGPDGTILGLLTLLDHEPRHWSEQEVELLQRLARTAATEIHLRRLLSERELREQKYRYDALHDPLTGLPNRSLFMKRLADATQRARRGEDATFAVLFLDLDGFKLVNDSMGHHVGDQLLAMVARRLEGCVRGGDIVARLGGDEFAILLERVNDVRDCAVVAERVLESMARPLDIGGYEHSSSCSIGIALGGAPHDQPEYVLRSADIAMYRAKSAGRGRYEMFDRAMHAEALARLQMESDLRHAFDREEFALEYQPIVSLSDGRIAGVEALVRWRHFERGEISPAVFIPVAEDTGLVVPLGRWVLREACRQARSWHDRYPGNPLFTVSVNLSVREFAQPDLLAALSQILEEVQLPPGHLNLEITESALLLQKSPAVETVKALREMGVGIHLDDFGTGYSALSYLHRLPLDAVKVDRVFTSSIDCEERSLHVMRAIVALAHAIGLEVIAEGVTREEQLRLLRAAGCDQAQGFYFARPLAAAEIDALLAEGRAWGIEPAAI